MFDSALGVKTFLQGIVQLAALNAVFFVAHEIILQRPDHLPMRVGEFQFFLPGDLARTLGRPIERRMGEALWRGRRFAA